VLCVVQRTHVIVDGSTETSMRRGCHTDHLTRPPFGKAPSLMTRTVFTVRVRTVEAWKECGKCEVGGGKEKKMYLILFRMKVLTKFAFAVFAKSTC
jgi:hypothetical protein